MAKYEIKKDNKLNLAHYRLKEVSHKVLALAIEQAQHIGVEKVLAGTKTIIVASYYAKVYDVDLNTAYDALKTAIDDLYHAEFRWRDVDDKGKINEYRTRFVSHIGYLGGQGAVEFVLTDMAKRHIFELERHFTFYEIRQLAGLGKYGTRLYELLCQFRKTGKLIISLENLRGCFGLLDDEYAQMNNFKRRVLDFAVQECLENTDIDKLTYEQNKEGRKIVGFTFKFKFKSKEDDKSKDGGRDFNTPDMFHKLTDKQVSYFGAKLASDQSFGMKYAKTGEDMRTFENRIKQDLTNPANQKKWADDLRRVGFSPQNKGG